MKFPHDPDQDSAEKIHVNEGEVRIAERGFARARHGAELALLPPYGKEYLDKNVEGPELSFDHVTPELILKQFLDQHGGLRLFDKRGTDLGRKGLRVLGETELNTLSCGARWVEKAYGDLETKVGNVFKKIRTVEEFENSANGTDVKAVIDFVNNQRVRGNTLTDADETSTAVVRMFQEHLPELGRSFGNSSDFNKTVRANVFRSQGILEEILGIKSERIIMVVKAPPGEEFLVSDSCVTTDFLLNVLASPGNVTSEAIFPLLVHLSYGAAAILMQDHLMPISPTLMLAVLGPVSAMRLEAYSNMPKLIERGDRAPLSEFEALKLTKGSWTPNRATMTVGSLVMRYLNYRQIVGSKRNFVSSMQVSDVRNCLAFDAKAFHLAGASRSHDEWLFRLNLDGLMVQG